MPVNRSALRLGRAGGGRPLRRIFRPDGSFEQGSLPEEEAPAVAGETAAAADAAEPSSASATTTDDDLASLLDLLGAFRRFPDDQAIRYAIVVALTRLVDSLVSHHTPLRWLTRMSLRPAT